MKRFFTLLAAAVLGSPAFIASAQMPQLPNDPAVRKGQLDNGLTYYIRHNDKPANRAEFYLATNAGAIQETPDQDGLAHFLEHMCFNGTKNFPGKALLDWLQSIGASFGGNINAGTGIDQTQYMLNNIPLVRPTVVDSCLLILHDYSHFVTCDPAEIDKERPVIIEERRSRRNASWRTFEKSLPYLFGDSKYSTCTLIGSQENLENFKPESLVNFYKTWYRPDMQAVVVVGDIDVDAVEAKIKAIWADVPKPENPKAKDKITLKEFTEPRVGVFTDKETTTPSIEVYWESDARDEAMNSTTAGFSLDFVESIISSVMRERFNDITSGADAPFLHGGFGIGGLCEAFEATFGSVTLKEDNILAGFTSFMTELEKMKRYGFSEAEVTRAKDNILASFEKAANEASTRKNPEFVHPLVSNFFDNQAYMEPQAEYEMAKAVGGQVNAQVLNQVVSQIIPDKNLVVIYSGPEKEGIATPSKEQLLKVMADVAKAEIAAPAEEAAAEPLMDPATLKGGKVRKTARNIYGSTEWTLKNGVKVIVLPTGYKKDQILFNLYKAGGESLISDADMTSFDETIYRSFKNVQGVSKFKGTDLPKMLAGKNISVGSYIDDIYHGISGHSSVKDLETALQLFYLAYAAPRFDQEEWDNAIDQLKSVLPNAVNTPNYALQKELNKVLYNDNPRNTTISMEKLEKADLRTVADNYKKLFSGARGATMVIVGDIDPETLKPLVEKYVGSLPKGKATKWQDVGPKMAKGENIDVFNTRMETPKTTVIGFYTDYSPYSVESAVNAKAVSYILDQIYVDTMREDEGGTYGASTAALSQKTPEDRTLLQVAFETKAEKAEKLRDIARDEFRKLAGNGPTDEQFNRTIENFKKNIPENRISNSYWMTNIIRYNKIGVDYDKEYEAAISNLSKESIKTAARRLLDSGNYTEIVQMPE